MRNIRAGYVWISLALFAGTLSLASLSNAQVAPPRLVFYQGQLRNDTGTPLSGTYNLEFRLYDALSGGNLLWGPEAHNSIVLTNGIFNRYLGSVIGLSDTVFATSGWLEIKVGSNTFSPRVQLAAVPYAFNAYRLEGKDSTFWARTVSPTFTGTVTVNGTFCGGETSNLVTGTLGFIGGGRNSRASGNYSVIGGGDSNTASGSHSTVSGGFQNTASGIPAATVGGGDSNTSSGNWATVSGGSNNSAGNVSNPYANVSGGVSNTASGRNSTVGGGNRNLVSHVDATISGGSENKITATFGTSATIGGGSFNASNSLFATIGGGYGNTAGGGFGGMYATIPGGESNVASGARSFAAGYHALALHDGAFVWNENSGGLDFASTGINQFLIRATGGVGINTDSPNGAFRVSGRARVDTLLIGTDSTAPIYPLYHASGALLTVGGVWTNASSRAYKHDISYLDTVQYRSLLSRLDAISVARYRYNAEGSNGEEHLGIIAEEGPEEIVNAARNGVPTGDAIGYLLAVSKALKSENEGLKSENQELRDRLDRIEAALGTAGGGR